MTAADILTMLDVDAMGERLQALPVLRDGTARLDGIALGRLWVKPGRHFHASYKVTLATDSGPVETTAWVGLLRRGHPSAEVYRQALSVPLPADQAVACARWDVARSTAILEAPRAIAQLFPWDYRLPTLPLALDPERVGRELGPDAPTACKVAGYWPGKRCQIKYSLAAGGTLYGKVFPDGAGPTVGLSPGMIARRVPGTDTLVAPRVRSYVRGFNLLVTEPIDGMRLVEVLNDPGCTAALARVGTALALFQRIPVPEIETRFGAQDDLAVVQAWVTLLSSVFPALARELFELLSALQNDMPDSPPSSAGLVHRDFYDRQILVTSSAVAVLDMDTASQGDGEIDIANFCSHLVLRHVQGQCTSAESARLQVAFVEAYCRLRPAMDRRLFAWYLAAALVRLACVHALRPRWRSIASPLIEESRRALRGALTP